MKGWRGYRRADGGLGARNYLAIIPSVYCVNEVAAAIARRVRGSKALLHHQGCGLLAPDLERVTRVLINLGTSANVGAVIIVSLGCESVEAEALREAIAASGRPVALVRLHQLGGYSATVEAGVEAGRRMMAALRLQRREHGELAELTMGMKCGSSDTTSGLATNPALGKASDLLIAAGGSSLFSETPELMGSEHLLDRRGAHAGVGEEVAAAVRACEREVNRFGVDMRGSQPTAGNIAGGISTIEEKSLGGICKAGSAPLQGVLTVGERPAGKGLWFIDGSGRELEALTALAAAGAQVIAFSTGLGAPHGFPIVPVVKLSANVHTCQFLGEHIDLNLSGVVEGSVPLAEAGAEILRKVVTVASGGRTQAERLGYGQTMDIEVMGPPV